MEGFVVTEWLDNRSKVEKAINGALKDAINAHGPITAENLSSASKRIYAALKAMRRESTASAHAVETHDVGGEG